MDIRTTVKELAAEREELKKAEMELKMKAGKYDEKVIAFMKELGAKEEKQVDFIEMLDAALNKSVLIL